jgi:N-sulfoglucosamine sulfohydrolase
MTRRMPFAPLALAAFSLAAAAAAGATPPNVLLIVSEDNGPELGCYGDPYARTPHLDRLAAGGVRFTRAYVTQAGCSQSRASIMTGLYPHQHGQLGLATWGFRLYREDTPNVVRSLKAAGYRTGILGKLHINPESAFPFDFQAMPGGNFARRDLAGYAQHAEAFFREAAAPFFLSVNYPEAHRPWLRQVDGLPAQPLGPDDVRPMPFLGVDEPRLRGLVADYYNSLARLDALVGDLLAALQRSGRAENTIVVYLGDHGADMLRGKRTSYEGGVRIPLIVRWPAAARAGQVRDELVSTVDLMPTLLAAAGVAPVGGLPGRSLLPLLRGERPAWRPYLFTEYHTHAAQENFYPQRTVRDDRFKLIENLLPGEVNPGHAFTLDHLEADLRGAIAAATPHTRGECGRR